MPEVVIVDEMLARELVIVDAKGRPRIRLAVHDDGEAEVIVSDEEGCFVSMTAGIETTLALRVDDGRQAVDVTTRGLQSWVMRDGGATKERIDQMETRTLDLERTVERLVEERGEQ